MEPYQINPFIDMIIRLTLNLTVTWMVAMGLYFHYSKKKNLVFCLFMFNLLIFIVGYLLSSTEISTGAGLGLFAIFTMLRYRSETLNFREMTYLFIVITIGLINSTSGIQNLGAMAFLDFVIVSLVFFLEKFVGSRILSTEKIKYDNLELLKPQYRQLLFQDIFLKTGIRSKSVDIETISIADKSATITIYYDEGEYINSFDQKSDNSKMITESSDHKGKNDKKRWKHDAILKVLH